MSSTKKDEELVWFPDKLKKVPLAEVEKAIARVVQDLIQSKEPVNCQIKALNEIRDTLPAVSLNLTLGDKIDLSFGKNSADN